MGRQGPTAGQTRPAGTLALTRVLVALLFGVGATEPVTIASVAALRAE